MYMMLSTGAAVSEYAISVMVYSNGSLKSLSWADNKGSFRMPTEDVTILVVLQDQMGGGATPLTDTTTLLVAALVREPSL